MRLRRALHQLLGLVGGATLFAATFAASVVLHGDLPAPRRFLARAVTRLLEPVFEGKLVLHQIEHLGFDGLDLQGAEAHDPWGRKVIDLQGVHVRLPMLRAVQRILSGGGAFALVIDDVRVDNAEVDIDAGPDGRSRLQAAFTPRPSGKPPGPPPSPGSFYLELSKVMVGHAWAHGEPVPRLPLQGEGTRMPGRLVVTERSISIDVERFSLRSELLAPLNPTGTADYHLYADVDGAPRMWTSFHGRLGEVTADVSAAMNGAELRASLDALRVEPAELRSLVPRAQLYDDLSLHAELKGVLPDLHATARAVAGVSEFNVSADARFVEGIEAEARWSALTIDPRLVAPAAPATTLSADGHVRVTLKETLAVEAEASSQPFLLGDLLVPGAKVQASFDGKLLKGEGQFDEQIGVNNHIAFAVEPTGAVEVNAELEAKNLRMVPYLRGALDGAAGAKVKAQITPAGVLDATIDGAFKGVGAGAFKVGQGTVDAHLSGPFDRLEAETSIGADRVGLGGLVIRRATLATSGPLLRPAVRLELRDEARWEKLALSAALKIAARPSLDQVKLQFKGGDVQAEASVGSVAVGPDGVSLKGLAVTGSTVRARGDVQIGPGGFSLRLSDGSVDLARLGRFLGPRLGAPALASVSSGTLAFRSDLDAQGARRSGRVEVEVRDLCSKNDPLILDARATFDLDGDGRAGDSAQVTSTLQASATHATCKEKPDEPDTVQRSLIAVAAASGRGTVRGSLLSAQSWKNLVGTASLDSLSADLGVLSGLPALTRARQQVASMPRLSGTLSLKGSVGRERSSELASGKVEVSTSQLRAELRPPPPPTTPTTPTAPTAPSTPATPEEPPRLVIKNRKLREERVVAIEGVDLRSTLEFKPSTDAGKLGGEWKVYVKNGERELIKLTAASAVAPDEALRAFEGLGQPEGTARRAEAMRWLTELPVSGSFALREVPFDELPKILQRSPVKGQAKVEGSFKGTLDRPEVEFKAELSDLQRRRETWERWRTSATLQGTLDERGVVVRGELGHRSDVVASTGGKASFWLMSTKRLGDLIWGRGSRWQVDAQANLDRWRLEATPVLSELGLRGEVSGVMQALRMHVQPTLWADLTLDNVQIYDANLAPTRVTVSLVEGGGFATARLTQPAPSSGGEGGSVEVTAFPTVTFRDRLIPELSQERIHPIGVRFNSFDIEPLSPLAAPVLADLRGKIDGEISLNVSKNPRENSISGGLRWRDGVLLIPQLGQTFTDGRLNATTSARPEQNETLIEIDSASLSATSGRITGAAGFFVPNDLLSRLLFPPEGGATAPSIRGHFAAKIDEKEKIPVTFEGLALGDAHGVTEGLIVASPESLAMRVAVPSLTFDLPETTSQQSLQDLSPSAEIGVVDASRRGAEKKQQGEGKARPVVIDVGLGSTLKEMSEGAEPTSSVLVRRASVDVRLAGTIRSTLDSEGLATVGTIETLSGRVVAMGKPFDVRRGFVRFEGPAGNPYLNVGARWSAPSGTQVFAELQGYLREAKLQLRSDPARPENEVLSLLLFGRDPASTGSDDTNSKLAVGGGVASTLLNSFVDLERIGHPEQIGHIETRVESTSSRGTSIGVAASVGSQLWIQVDVSTATQRERQNADLTAISLDWRFRPNWSLRTSIGDRGSSLMELFWQFKY